MEKTCEKTSSDTISRKHFCKALSDLEGVYGIIFFLSDSRHPSKCTKTIRKEKAALCIWSLLSASRHLLSQTLWILRSRLPISLMEYFDLYMSLKIARICFFTEDSNDCHGHVINYCKIKNYEIFHLTFKTLN